jgi:hypothetical protein
MEGLAKFCNQVQPWKLPNVNFGSSAVNGKSSPIYTGDEVEDKVPAGNTCLCVSIFVVDFCFARGSLFVESYLFNAETWEMRVCNKGISRMHDGRICIRLRITPFVVLHHLRLCLVALAP